MAKRALLLILTVSVMAAGAYAGGFALSGVSSKAIGMGGAFRGLADNWSAAYWNPAGLAQLEESEFNLMGIAINPIAKMTPQIRYGDFEVGFKNDEWRYPKEETHLAANVSGFLKLPSREDLTFGVAVFAPYALGSRWDIFSPIYSDAAGEFPTWDHEAVLKVIDIHPSVGKSFMDGNLMLGAGFSIYNGTIDYRKTLLSQTPLPRPHDNVAIDAFLEGDGWGYGANFGILYKLTEKLQVGISGKTASKIKFKGDVRNTLYTINNTDLQAIAMGQAQTLGDTALIDFIFDDNLEHWTNEAEADLKLPADAGIGFAYKASEKLTLTMDIAYTFWSSLDSIVIEIKDLKSGDGPPGGGEDSLVIPTAWDDILRLSMGGLYRVSEPLEMRFGFFYDPSPIPDVTFSPLFVDIGNKYSFNIGSALHLSNWEIGYNFEYILFDALDIAPDPDAGSEFDNYPGQYESAIIANHLSVTYRF